MAKISNTSKYPLAKPITLDDFLIGTYKETGKTKNFVIREILDLINKSTGVTAITSSDGSLFIERDENGVVDIVTGLTDHVYKQEIYIDDMMKLPITITSDIPFVIISNVFIDGQFLNKEEYMITADNQIIIIKMPTNYVYKDYYELTIFGSIYVE